MQEIKKRRYISTDKNKGDYIRYFRQYEENGLVREKIMIVFMTADFQ